MMGDASTVLIVEDNERTSELLELLFTTEGYATERLADGALALERLQGEPAALVVLDVTMPKVDGVDVLRAIRANSAWAETPVIMTSARGADEEIWQGWRAGADCYLVKPYKLDALWSTAEELLRTGQLGTTPAV
jgi:DNA-binding response OmpR family regulator